MNTQERVLSFLCLAEMPYSFLNKLIQSQIRYLGNDENILSMQALKNIYEVVTQNLKLAHAKLGDNNKLIETKLKEGDLVLVKDHMAKAFQPLICWKLSDCFL